MTREFKPMLIGKYTDRIELQTKSWTRLIFAGNELLTDWIQYFNEELTLKDLAIVMNVPDLKFYIQEKFVRKNPKHLDFLNSMNVKIEKLIEMIDIPPFDHLIKSVANLKAAIYPNHKTYLNTFNPANAGSITIPEVGEHEFDNWKTNIFDGSKFYFATELEASINKKNSVFTKNFRETAAYLYMQRLSETLNVLNDCGLSFINKDYPRSVFSELETFSTGKLHSELKFQIGGQPQYLILNFKPKLTILDANSQILQAMKNLSDKQIFELIDKLQP